MGTFLGIQGTQVLLRLYEGAGVKTGAGEGIPGHHRALPLQRGVSLMAGLQEGNSGSLWTAQTRLGWQKYPDI